MTNENVIELPNLTDTEELHVALKVFRGKRGVRRFVEEHGFDVLESCKNVVDQIVVEKLEELQREEEKRKNHEAAVRTAAQGYIDAMMSAGVEVTMEEALAALMGATIDSNAPRKRVARKSSGEARSPRKEYKFIIGGETISRPFARPSKEIKEEMESNGYTEQWMLLAPKSVEEFLKDAADQQKYKAHIETMKEFFEKKSLESGEEEVAIEGFDSKVEFGLTLDIETAKDKFNVEMTEDFIFEGSIDQLTSEQEKLLIAISDDETVEGGIEAIEALS